MQNEAQQDRPYQMFHWGDFHPLFSAKLRQAKTGLKPYGRDINDIALPKFVVKERCKNLFPTLQIQVAWSIMRQSIFVTSKVLINLRASKKSREIDKVIKPQVSVQGVRDHRDSQLKNRKSCADIGRLRQKRTVGNRVGVGHSRSKPMFALVQDQSKFTSIWTSHFDVR